MNRLCVLVIRTYQLLLSPWLGAHCRFYPSCSHYAIQVLQKEHLAFALVKIGWRLLRCNPFHPGGVDEP